MCVFVCVLLTPCGNTGIGIEQRMFRQLNDSQHEGRELQPICEILCV